MRSAGPAFASTALTTSRRGRQSHALRSSNVVGPEDSAWMRCSNAWTGARSGIVRRVLSRDREHHRERFFEAMRNLLVQQCCLPPPGRGHRDLYAVGDHAHECEIFVREYVRLSVDEGNAMPTRRPRSDDRHVEEGARADV